MNARGFTFVELIIAIIVIGIAVGGVLMVAQTTVAKSADPMLQHQAVAIAESYLEEILTKNFTGITPVCTSRPTYNSASCYDGLVQAPTNAAGNALGALSEYTVAVNIGGSGSCGAGLGADESSITVIVTHPSGITYSLDGCITNY